MKQKPIDRLATEAHVKESEAIARTCGELAAASYDTVQRAFEQLHREAHGGLSPKQLETLLKKAGVYGGKFPNREY